VQVYTAIYNVMWWWWRGFYTGKSSWLGGSDWSL